MVFQGKILMVYGVYSSWRGLQTLMAWLRPAYSMASFCCLESYRVALIECGMRQIDGFGPRVLLIRLVRVTKRVMHSWENSPEKKTM